MHLRLGDDDEPGPVLRHVTDNLWDQLATQGKGERWLAFGGNDATVWLRLSIREGRTVATGMLVGTAEPLSVAELRKIPLGRLLNIAATHGDDALRVVLPPEQQQDIPALPRKHAGRRGVSVVELQRVRDAWIQAGITDPRKRMKRTAELTGRSLAQTRRLVRRVESSGWPITNPTNQED